MTRKSFCKFCFNINNIEFFVFVMSTNKEKFLLSPSRLDIENYHIKNNSVSISALNFLIDLLSFDTDIDETKCDVQTQILMYEFISDTISWKSVEEDGIKIRRTERTRRERPDFFNPVLLENKRQRKKVHIYTL